MKIALSYVHYPVSAGKFLKKAFIRQGVEVKSFGPTTLGWIPWNPDVDYSQYQDLSDNYLIDNYGFDHLIHVDGNFKVQGQLSFPVSVYSVDNHVRTYNDRHYQKFFGAHSEGSKGLDTDNFLWVPCGYDPTEHFNKKEERPIDGLMVGVAYEARMNLLKKLGSKFTNILGATGYLGTEYNDIYNQAKIAIVKSANKDVAMRVFENMAQGCCVLADWVPDFEKLGLKNFSQLVTYRTDDEAVELFGVLVADNKLRTNIAKDGEEWVRSHTWDERVKVMLNAL